MNLNTWIKETFHTCDFNITKTDKGISNTNYILEIGTDKYMLRIPKAAHKSLGLQFEHEKQVLKQVQDLDVPNVLFDTEQGIKVTQYVENTQTYNECKDLNRFARCAILMKQLHSKDAPEFVFDPFQKIKDYKNQIEHPIVTFQNEDAFLEALKSIYNPNTLCHNDFVEGNILYHADRDYLIDYEYAAKNDYRFDIASFFSENNIFYIDQREQFYQAYFGDDIDPMIDVQVQAFEKMEDILWGYWANMLYEKRNEDIYLQIAKEKEKHYEGLR